MFTIVSGINNRTISILSGINTGQKGLTHNYTYKFWKPEEGIIEGQVKHIREEGLERLTIITLEDILNK